MKERLLEILKKFQDCKVLVIGDIMLDKYMFGGVNRISREAPVQIVKINEEKNILGGAGNTANNVSSLGGKVFVIGLVGRDERSKELINEFNKKNITVDYIIKDDRPTTQKTRIIALNQQLLRIDHEDDNEIGKVTEKKVLEIIKKLISDIDIILVSDYNKGMITKNLMKNLIRLSEEKNKFVIVDPRPNHKEYYKGCDLITPNQAEAGEMVNIKESGEEGLKKISKKIIDDLDCDVLITRGKDGMSLFTNRGEVKNFPTKAREVYDVSGAGDTVVACLGLSIACGANLEEAITISNYGAGIVVGKFGTATVNIEEMIDSIKNGTD